MKQIRQTIGLIGCGNMGSAIAAGLLENRIAGSRRVFVYDSLPGKKRRIARLYRVRSAQNLADLVRSSAIVLLAVKPQDLSTVAKEIRSVLKSSHIVISILAGVPIQKLRRLLGGQPTVVRAMPNLGAQVGEAVTALASPKRSALQTAEIIFSGCGKTVRLSEKHFDLVTAVSGSGPAYFFLMMELLAKFGETRGLSKEAARLLAVQTALGAGRLAEATGDSPEALRKKVTSKKGTTEAALHVLFQKGFPKIFRSAVHQAIRRSKALSRLS